LYYAVCRPAWYQAAGYGPGIAVIAFGSADSNNTGNVSGIANSAAADVNRTENQHSSLPVAEGAPVTNTFPGNPQTEDQQILP